MQSEILRYILILCSNITEVQKMTKRGSGVMGKRTNRYQRREGGRRGEREREREREWT